MGANEDKIVGTIDGGQRLVDNGNLYSERVKDKIGSIKDRLVPDSFYLDIKVHFVPGCF